MDSIPQWLLDRLDVDYPRLWPLWAQERRFGWLRPEFAQMLRRWPEVFDYEEGRVAFSSSVESAHLRSQAMAGVLDTLRAEGCFDAWRDERFSIYAEASSEPVLAMERGAIKRFGARGRSTHVNGLVDDVKGPAMWIARRSERKATDPGKLDNLIGGGIAEGYDPWDTLIKEAWEEAGISPQLAQSAHACDTLRFDYLVADGLDSNEVECFDLLLPADFQPACQDGEVQSFELLSLDEVHARLMQPELFTVDAALVIWNCLRRWQQSGD
jgi:8-oxo-dGTP pyrophosphatase MutT (NUDIX family)